MPLIRNNLKLSKHVLFIEITYDLCLGDRAKMQIKHIVNHRIAIHFKGLSFVALRNTSNLTNLSFSLFATAASIIARVHWIYYYAVVRYLTVVTLLLKHAQPKVFNNKKFYPDLNI